MAEEKDIFDAPEDFKFPDTDVPDDERLFEEGEYIGIVGRIVPFFVGRDGKKWKEGDPDKRLFNVTQEIWVINAMSGYNTPEQKIIPRIIIKQDSVEFVRNDSRGVKLFESFPTAANPVHTKLSWKAKQFYHSFPGVIVGEKGHKRIVWEQVKSFYGQMVQFTVKYTEKNGRVFRNVVDVSIFDGEKNKLDVSVMAKIEETYSQLRALEQQREKEQKAGKQPDSNIDDVPF